MFRNGIASTSPGKLANVPPVMHATRAPTIYEMMPIPEKPSLMSNFSLSPLFTIQYSAIITPAKEGMRPDIRDRNPWNALSNPSAARSVPHAPAIPVVILNLLSSKPSRLLRARPPEYAFVTFVVHVASTSASNPRNGTPSELRIAEISYCPVTMLISAPVMSMNNPAGITPTIEDLITSPLFLANLQ